MSCSKYMPEILPLLARVDCIIEVPHEFNQTERQKRYSALDEFSQIMSAEGDLNEIQEALLEAQNMKR